MPRSVYNALIDGRTIHLKMRNYLLRVGHPSKVKPGHSLYALRKLISTIMLPVSVVRLHVAKVVLSGATWSAARANATCCRCMQTHKKR